MKIGIVGPAGLVNKINQVIETTFPSVESVNCIYKVYTEAPTIIKYQQRFLDAVLFAGTTPYLLVKNAMLPEIPWELIPRNGSSLLRVLLEASLERKHAIYNVSIDSYKIADLHEAYQEIGISKERLKLFVAEQNIDEPDYLEQTYKFHETNFLDHNVTCCFTALESVYERLIANDVPCLMIKPTANVIRETIKKLILNHKIQISQQSQIVALYIHIDEPNEYSFLNEDEYQCVIDKMKIAKQIYIFAQKIQAAVIEVGLKEYLLFSTRQMLDNELNNSDSISLLDSVKQNSSSTISLGIGFGVTAVDSKQNARAGMLRASKKGGNMAYIVTEDKVFTGPIKSVGSADNSPKKVDEKYLAISEKTGVSINTVIRLCSIIEQYGKNSFTSLELAEFFGITLRSMNRVIEKLESNNYCTIIGKKSVASAGRPRRIIQIHLN